MKLNDHANSLQTNVQNEVQSFGIADNSIIFEILRKRMYGNPIQTLVQEYICNARDAMREVGKGNDFDITVPTELNPVFKVRDFGPGISPDRMANVFILYGASTKRDSNHQTGGFGIGAKSAWSYIDSFTIVSVVDGTKRSYVAHIGANNNGRLDLISTEPTKEQNGTEIQVAVKRNDVSDFRKAVLRAIYFWDEKPNLKGTLDEPQKVEGLKVGALEMIKSRVLPDYIDGNSWSSEPVAVIDGIPYSINEKLLNKCPTLRKLTSFTRGKPVFYFNNGVLEVAASREAIADGDITKTALEKMASKTFLEVKTHIAGRFGAVKDVKQYIQVYTELNSVFNVESGFAKYKDYTINNANFGSTLFKDVKITKIHCIGRHSRKGKKIRKEELKDGDKNIPLTSFNHLFFFAQQESLIVQNKRVRPFLDTQATALYIIETIDSNPNSAKAYKQILADLEVQDFQTLTYVVLPKETKVAVSRDKTEFCVHTLDGYRHKYLTLSGNTEKWFYVPINKDGNWEISTDVLKDMSAYFHKEHDVKLCGLAGRALENGTKMRTCKFEVVALGKEIRNEVLYGRADSVPQSETEEVEAEEMEEVDEDACKNYGEEDVNFYNFCPECGEPTDN